MNKNVFEIIFYGRGGQGSKSAAEILAQAAFRDGKFVQAFPQFGPERSGAPTKTFVRISSSPIRTHEPITNPDLVVVLDETIMNSEIVTQNLDKDEILIINSKSEAWQIREKIKIMGGKFTGKIHPIDANGISINIIGQPRPNTVILGKLIKVSEIAKLESIIAEFRKIFEKKIGKDATDKNVLAIEKAYDTI